MSNKKAFSVLEIVFVVLIIAIISSIAIPKLLNNKFQTNIVKAKGDIALIRKAIKEDFNKQVMKQNSNEYIEKLDESSIDERALELFTGLEGRVLLKYPLYSTDSSENESGKWIKQSDSNYEIVLDSEIKVEFVYDNSDGSFECDTSEEYCMELMQ